MVKIKMNDEVAKLMGMLLKNNFKELLNSKIKIENEIKKEFPNLDYYFKLTILEIYITILSDDFNIKQLFKLVSIVEKFNYHYSFLKFEDNNFILGFFENYDD